MRWNSEYHHDPEPLGFIEVGVGRAGILLYGAVFSSLAMTELGRNIANCDNKISFGSWSIAVSSIVSGVLTIGGITNAIVCPLFGSYLDTVNSTKWLLIILLRLYPIVTLLGLLCLLSSFEESKTAFVLYVLMIFLMGILGETSFLLLSCYLPELGNNDKERLTISSKMYFLHNIGQVLAILPVIGLSLAVSPNDMQTGIYSGVIGIIWWCLHTPRGYRKLGPRLKIEVEETIQSRLSIKSVAKDAIYKYPNVGLFLLGYSFITAGTGTTISLAPVYMKEEVGADTLYISMMGLLVIIFSVPGALLSNKLTKGGKLKRTLFLLIGFWTGTILLTPFLVYGDVVDIPIGQHGNITVLTLCNNSATETMLLKRQPGKGVLPGMVLIGTCLGLGIGAIFPTLMTFLSELIPGGQESSFFGLKTFAGTVMSWLPSLIFVFLNEATDSMKPGFLSFASFFIVGCVPICFIDLEKAKEDIKPTLWKRRSSILVNPQLLPSNSTAKVVPAFEGSSTGPAPDQLITET